MFLYHCRFQPLTQPLFNRGTNIANLKIAQTKQEEAGKKMHRGGLIM